MSRNSSAKPTEKGAARRSAPKRLSYAYAYGPRSFRKSPTTAGKKTAQKFRRRKPNISIMDEPEKAKSK
jgi:hypothetical protein